MLAFNVFYDELGCSKVAGDCSFFFFELLSNHVSEKNGVD